MPTDVSSPHELRSQKGRRTKSQCFEVVLERGLRVNPKFSFHIPDTTLEGLLIKQPEEITSFIFIADASKHNYF
jgi:hypothetical protein